MKQFDKITHPKYGQGIVVSVTFRKDNDLIMVYFPENNTHEWFLSEELQEKLIEENPVKEFYKLKRTTK